MDGLHALLRAARDLDRSSGSKRKKEASDVSTGGLSGAKKPKQTSPNPLITQRKIEPLAFVNERLGIGESQSKNIFEELKSAGFLSEDGDVNKNNSGLESYVCLLDDAQTSDQQEFILNLLDSNPSIIQRKIEPTAFVNQGLNISESQSTQIFKELKDAEVLSADGSVKTNDPGRVQSFIRLLDLAQTLEQKKFIWDVLQGKPKDFGIDDHSRGVLSIIEVKRNLNLKNPKKILIKVRLQVRM